MTIQERIRHSLPVNDKGYMSVAADRIDYLESVLLTQHDRLTMALRDISYNQPCDAITLQALQQIANALAKASYAQAYS